MGNITEWATTGTDIPQNHKRGGTMVETFRQVRAACFFTDRVQIIFAQGLFNVINPVSSARQLYFDPFRLTEHFLFLSRNDGNRNVPDLFIIAEFYSGFCLYVTH